MKDSHFVQNIININFCVQSFNLHDLLPQVERHRTNSIFCGGIHIKDQDN